MKRFIFLVHPLSEAHRKIMALRCRFWRSLHSGHYGKKEIAALCRFRFREDIEGIVMSIPLIPDEMIEDQDRALEYLQHAYRLAVSQFGPVDVVGLGSLCSVVASRGLALQEKIPVPVTTGNAATAWCLYQHVIQTKTQERIAVLGSLSAVGMVSASLLMEKGYNISLDKKRAGKKLGLPFGSPEEIVKGASIVVGCRPTGPSLDASALDENSIVFDVALPQTLRGYTENMVYQGEGMSMPPNWHRGFWGPLYHVISGYGWNTILACVVEPLALVSSNRDQPYALGSRINPQAVLDFGKEAMGMGFNPKLILHQKG